MSVFVWFVGSVLITLSLVLLFAGLTGREGILRIGKMTAGEPRKDPSSELQLLFNIVLGIIGVLAGIKVIQAFAL